MSFWCEQFLTLRKYVVQANGFRYQIISKGQIQNNADEYNLHFNILFIDYKQTYDKAIRNLGMPSKLITVITITLEQTKCRVILENKMLKLYF